MHAKSGDHLIIKGHRVGDPERRARIIEVQGEGGEPPYLVEWSDDGHESLVYPGPDAVIETKKKSA